MTLTIEEKREIFRDLRDGRFIPSDTYDERNQFADGLGTMQFTLIDHACVVVDDVIYRVRQNVEPGDPAFLANMLLAIREEVARRKLNPLYIELYWLDLRSRGPLVDYKGVDRIEATAIHQAREYIAWLITANHEGLDLVKVESF